MLQHLYRLMDQGEWVQLKREAEGMLRLDGLDDFTMGRLYRALGRAHFGLSQYDASLQCFEIGRSYALRASDWDSVGFMQHNLAVAHMMLGNLEAAESGFEQFLLRLHKYQSALRLEGLTHYNLGLLYRQKRQYDLALAAYAQALQCFEQRGEHRNAGDTHQNMAWLLLLERKTEEARLHITKAAAYLATLPDDFHTEQLILSALYCLALGDYTSSMGYLLPIIEERVKVLPKHKAAATWVLAELHAQQGHLDQAQRHVHEALAIAIEKRETHLVTLCLETEARIRGMGGGGDKIHTA